MFATLLGIAGKLFGISSGASLVNNIGGVVTNATAIGALSYLLTHANQQVTFSTSLGFLGLIAGFSYLLVEVMRRSRAG